MAFLTQLLEVGPIETAENRKSRQMIERDGRTLSPVAGDVIVEGDDIYGDCVNVASRLESIAPNGGILLSKQVYDHIGNRSPVNIVSLGEQTVKNIKRPIEVYKVDFDKKSSNTDIIRFGEYELDTGLFELRENGETVAVEPQVFNLIAYLAKNHDRTVTKDELFENIWHGRIVSDAALSSQII